MCSTMDSRTECIVANLRLNTAAPQPPHPCVPVAHVAERERFMQKVLNRKLVDAAWPVCFEATADAPPIMCTADVTVWL